MADMAAERISESLYRVRVKPHDTSARTARDSTMSAVVTVKKANTASMVHLHRLGPPISRRAILLFSDREIDQK